MYDKNKIYRLKDVFASPLNLDPQKYVKIKNKTRILFLILPTRRLNGIEDSALKSNMHPTNNPTVPLLT